MAAVISGLFALLGGFFGAWLTRRTEYEKWLRKEQSTNFAEFLKQIHGIRKDSSDIRYDRSLEHNERIDKILGLFTGLNGQENVVRLYLKDSDRERFTILVHELAILFSPETDDTIRIKKVDKVLSEIQSIFEQTIHNNLYHCWWDRLCCKTRSLFSK